MANAGFGGAQAGSVETRSLRAINSQGQSFVNKDFVKNVAWLNNSVDTLSVYTQMLQKGVDDANQSFIEEIQGFAADLFVLFAGGQPTGIDIGDLKYVFQGLGALLGVNGDTPFPLNLVEAANNLFGNWIVPLPQFSDVIFDAIEAWAEDLGLSQELVESLETLNNSFVNLSTDVEDFITDLFRLLNVFGTNFEVLQPFWNALESLFGDLDMPSLQPVLDALSSVGVSVINSLTWVVDTLDSAISPLAAVSAGLVGGKGANVLPVVSDKTTQWTVGSNTATMWVYDQSEQAFKTVGSGITKSVITQHKLEVTPGKKLDLGGSIKWVGIPSAATGFQIAAAFYVDNTVLQTVPITIPTGHDITGGYVDLSSTIVVPATATSVKVGAWIDNSITTGTVYVKNLSLASTGLIAQELIDGLVDELLGFLRISWVDDLWLAIQGQYHGDDTVLQQIQGVFQFTSSLLSGFNDWISSATNLFGLEDWQDFIDAVSSGPQQLWGSLGFLSNFSPINASQIFGQLLPEVFGQVPASALSSAPVNLLPGNNFPAGSIVENIKWFIDEDGSKTSDGTGAARVEATGESTALISGKDINDRIYINPGSTISARVSISHSNYTGNGLKAVVLQLIPFIGDYMQPAITLNSYVPTVSTLEWPGFLLEGDTVVPSSVTSIQLQILLTGNISTGSFRFDEAAVIQNKLIDKNLIAGLPDELSELTYKWQGILDVIVNTFNGTTDIFHTISDLIAALKNIPGVHVTGMGGPENIIDSVQELLNQFGAGMAGEDGEFGLADVFNLSQMIRSWANLGKGAFEILGIRNNEPVDQGMLPSGTANFSLAAINTTLELKSSSSFIVSRRIQKDSSIGVLSWLGYGNANITGFYIIIWKVNPITGNRTPIMVSDNEVGILMPGTSDSNIDWHFYEFPNINLAAGDDIDIEIYLIGTGTHYIRGIDTQDKIPDHPFAQIVSLASKRLNPDPNDVPDEILKSNILPSSKIPWFEIAIDTGSNNDAREPVLYLCSQSESIPIPNWCNVIEAVPLGGGGGGHLGILGLAKGSPGNPGRFGYAIWKRDIDFDDDITNILFVKGAGGHGGSDITSMKGQRGSDSIFTLGTKTVVGQGGSGGSSPAEIFASPVGVGPGEFTLGDNKLRGGLDQKTLGGNGTTPGGAANGGNNLVFTGSAGGSGGAGAGWILFSRDSSLISAPDTISPTAPTLSVQNITYSTVTLSAEGSTDDN